VSELKRTTACVVVDQFQVNEENRESGDFSSWGELEAGEDGEEFVQDRKSALVKSLPTKKSVVQQVYCLNYSQNTARGSSAPAVAY
jgi:hypothetical protein